MTGTTKPTTSVKKKVKTQKKELRQDREPGGNSGLKATFAGLLSNIGNENLALLPASSDDGKEPAGASVGNQVQQAVTEKQKKGKPVPPPAVEDPVSTGNPYDFMKKIKGPLVQIEEPYLVKVPEGHENLDTTVNFRMPLNLKSTVDDHCFAIKMKNSDWFRRAVKYLLAAEQEAMRGLE